MQAYSLMIPEDGEDFQVRNLSTSPLTGNGDYGDYHEWRLAVSDALRGAGYDGDADEFWDCSCDKASFWTANKIPLGDDSGVIRAYVCEEHGAKVVRKTCHLRICPDCARRAANRLLARFMPKIQECLHQHHSRFRFRKIVLTTPFCLTDPDAKAQYRRLKKDLSKVFNFLLPVGWRSNQGLIVADEWGENGLKLHFHILFYGQWLSNKQRDGFPLSTAWRTVTGGDCEVAYVSGVGAERVEAEVIETLKYCVKFWKTDPNTGVPNRLSPSLMVILHEMLKGERRVRAYGIFYRLNAVPDRDPVCPRCGRLLVRMSVIEYNIWLATGWLPEEQTLYLRLGNKSPPEAMPGNGDSPEPANEIFAKPVQPPLSVEFGRLIHAMPYL